jgi:hypothetical protein
VTWNAIAFRQGAAETADEVDIVYSLKQDWRGQHAELEVLDIVPAAYGYPIEAEPWQK